MASEDIYSWSSNAASNGNIDVSINFAEGQLPSTVNNSARSVLAACARHLATNNATATASGSANAYTATIAENYTLATGRKIRIKAPFTNNAAATLAVTNAAGSALGAKPIRKFTPAGEAALVASNMVLSAIYDLNYDASASTGSGAWILLNPTGVNLAADVTGDLPFSAITSASARTVFGVTGSVAADMAPIQGTIDQVFRVDTVGSALAFGPINLASGSAVTGDLPFANITQLSARSVLGVTGSATADVAGIQGTIDQVFRVDTVGSTAAFGPINLASSNAVTGNLAVSHLNSGTSATASTVWTGGAVWMPYREVLTAIRTYYVRTDGSDSNTGLVDSAGGGFLTIQKAIDVVSGTLDQAGFAVTIQVNAGTYTGSVRLRPLFGGVCTIQGDTTTPSNVIISTTSATAIAISSTAYGPVGGWTLTGFKIQVATSGTSILISNMANLIVNSVIFGSVSAGFNHVEVTNNALVQMNSNYSVIGAAAAHWQATDGGRIVVQSRTVTLTGTPAFSTAFAVASRTGTILANGDTFVNSGTGSKFSISLNGVIDTLATNSTTYLPGSSAGTTATGGQYG